MRWAPAIGLAVAAAACAAAPEAGAPTISQARRSLEAAPPRAEGATVMVVFATWADGARELLPRLAELGRTHAGRGLRVVAVAIDEDQRFVEPFLRELGVTMRVLADPGGREIERTAKLERLPALLFFDAKGEPRAPAVGAGLDPVAELEAAVESLLGPASPDRARAEGE